MSTLTHLLFAGAESVVYNAEFSNSVASPACTGMLDSFYERLVMMVMLLVMVLGLLYTFPFMRGYFSKTPITPSMAPNK